MSKGNRVSKTVYWAEAPASTMVFGEHAVLQGHCAIVMAINYRLKVQLKGRSDRKVIIKAMGATHRLDLDHLQPLQPSLKLIFHYLEQFKPLNGFDLVIDSNINSNVGLGSSAALINALITVFSYHEMDLGQLNLKDKEKIHQKGLEFLIKVQGQASGADLAASLFGSVIVYSMQKGLIEYLDPPLEPMQLIYCGYKTSTAEVLRHVRNFLDHYPQASRAIDELGIISQLAIRAWREKDSRALFDLCLRHNQQMALLELTDSKLERMLQTLYASSIPAKISGSGLGDSILCWKRTFELADCIHIEAPCDTIGLTAGINCS
jgi:mevalonate kinase